ncbi:MAG: glycosyltransferase family 2 protein [Gemmatimonadota bacterium]
MTGIPTVSVVVPVHNEERNLGPLLEAVADSLGPLGLTYEVVFVDDGSADGSLARIRALIEREPRVVLVKLSRNFGHQRALSAGMRYARGECVITMDADLQHPPELLPTLIERWREGYDVVYTVRKDPKETPWIKRATSAGFYRILNAIARMHIPAGAADFRLLDRKIVDLLEEFPERNLFFRGLTSWMGFRQMAVPYTARPRLTGESQYSFTKMLRLAADGITSYTSFPLQLATMAGIAVAGLSFLYGTYAVSAWLFTEQTVPGWTSVLVSVLFLGGIQLISIGIVGAYVGQIFQEAKGRPRYLVESVENARER